MLWRRLTNALIERTLRFKAGAKLVVESGTNAAATEISMTELKAINDVAGADLAKIDGITNGTAAANKAVVLGATKNIDTFRMTGKLYTPQAAPETSTDTATLTDAQMLSGILVATPTAAAAYTTLTG